MQFSLKSFCFAFSFHHDQVLHAFLMGGREKSGKFFGKRWAAGLKEWFSWEIEWCGQLNEEMGILKNCFIF
jgi:hypothetical protein